MTVSQLAITKQTAVIYSDQLTLSPSDLLVFLFPNCKCYDMISHLDHPLAELTAWDLLNSEIYINLILHSSLAQNTKI